MHANAQNVEIHPKEWASKVWGSFRTPADSLDGRW